GQRRLQVGVLPVQRRVGRVPGGGYLDRDPGQFGRRGPRLHPPDRLAQPTFVVGRLAGLGRGLVLELLVPGLRLLVLLRQRGEPRLRRLRRAEELVAVVVPVRQPAGEQVERVVHLVGLVADRVRLLELLAVLLPNRLHVRGQLVVLHLALGHLL